MSHGTDPLWKVLTVLETDYSDYGGRVVRWQDPKQSYEDCSSSCRWACYLEGSGDWLVCTKPGAPRLGLLTWEHQAGLGCYEWGCLQCGKPECDCVEVDHGTDPLCQALADQLGPLPQLHQRQEIVERAAVESHGFLCWLVKRHGLTAGEQLRVVGEVAQEWCSTIARRLIRVERHGTTEKPGDEA